MTPKTTNTGPFLQRVLGNSPEKSNSRGVRLVGKKQSKCRVAEFLGKPPKTSTPRFVCVLFKAKKHVVCFGWARQLFFYTTSRVFVLSPAERRAFPRARQVRREAPAQELRQELWKVREELAELQIREARLGLSGCSEGSEGCEARFDGSEGNCPSNCCLNITGRVPFLIGSSRVQVQSVATFGGATWLLFGNICPIFVSIVV